MIKAFHYNAMRIVLTIVLSITTFISFAQEKGVDVDINVKKESDWYQQPWVWIVGGAVFILILVALLRGKSTKNG